MNITKEKRKKIQNLRKKGYTIREIALKVYPYTTIQWGQSSKPIRKVCSGIHFVPAWNRLGR